MYDFAIIGGGIVGLAVGLRLSEARPASSVLILEKEGAWASHQSGRNSGVIHSGVYYAPGSLKARLARAGNRAMVRFCREHGIAHEICGKLIVAVEERELAALERIRARGMANGVQVEWLHGAEIERYEPFVRGVAALHVPSAGIVDYREVANRIASLLEERGADLRLNSKVVNIIERGEAITIETEREAFQARTLINCAGLHSDRIARMCGVEPGVAIVPFRGEYYELVPERRHLVRNLIYPVPNPDFPFLGVHFTRMIGGSVHAGPNAVLALKREGYRWTDIALRDAGEIFAFSGFWHLARRYWREGAFECWRSASKRAFVKSLQRLVPSVQAEDLIPAGAGVRAQALRPDGSLVDDFLIVRGRRSFHVCNAPSPAATASLEIAKMIVADLLSRSE
ncbi:L-2-hydroxyglutarate oxidase [Pyrinomonas methylaliphatogenes]|uniref:Predicted dehydrogenase n=1 Tax=Pyrinomonas methylaliphatogenes TaxID=454194 RepID=A0A0B6WXS8_9BACT|nr:L-2-hydroxyglutarate oxidase [Pyrinomonas methylaliphatogenes]CDM65916.1 predicted dehydrogenase [Pyrinomonas methylaliphatogenes]